MRCFQLIENNQGGRVLILVLIFMLTLSAFWVIALSMTGSELQLVGGRKTASQQFYDAEAGVSSVLSGFSANLPNPSDSLVSAHRDVAVTDAEGNAVSLVTVRPIQNIDAVAAANNKLPVQEHIASPPQGSGFDAETWEVNRFAVTGVSGKKEVQVGVYKFVLRP